MKYFRFFLFIPVFIHGFLSLAGEPDTIYYEYWDINSLTAIGGNEVSIYGEPLVISTEKGDALQFDGINDAVFVHKNPFGDAKEFTFEVFFRPASGQPNITSEPRFVCFWDPDDAGGPRMTIEIRVITSGEWYFDAFLKTDAAQLTLTDAVKTHPTGQWMHAAVTYKDNVFTTYVNGQQELSGSVGYTDKVLNPTGKTSVGARYNLANWYNGAIRAIKVTHKALDPDAFFSIPDTAVNYRAEITAGENSPEIYPVPAHSKIFISEIRGGQTLLSVSLSSIAGQILLQQEFSGPGSLRELDVSNLPNGIYFVELHFPGTTVTKKISIVH
jgi:hypothetical protein